MPSPTPTHGDQREVLENGLPLCWVNMPYAHTVSFVAVVPGGVTYETRATNGLGHLVEHLHMSTTRSYPTREAVLRAIAEVPGEINAVTTPDRVIWYWNTVPGCAVLAGRLLAEILDVRSWPDEVVASEERLVTTEIAQHPSVLDMDAWLVRTLIPTHSYAMPQAGTPRSVRRLSRAAIEAYDRTHFAPHNVVVGIAGALAAAEMEQIRQCLAALPAGSEARPTPQPGPRLKLPVIRRLGLRLKEQVVSLGFVLTEPLTPQEQAVLNTIRMGLGSLCAPILNRVRYEQSSTYYYWSHGLHWHDLRIPYVYAWTRRRDRLTLIQAALRELADIRAARVGDTWLPSTQRSFLFHIAKLCDEPAYLAWRTVLGEIGALGRGGWSVDEEMRCVQSLTAADLSRFAERWLTRDRFFLLFTSGVPYFRTRRIRQLVREVL